MPTGKKQPLCENIIKFKNGQGKADIGSSCFAGFMM